MNIYDAFQLSTFFHDIIKSTTNLNNINIYRKDTEVINNIIRLKDPKFHPEKFNIVLFKLNDLESSIEKENVLPTFRLYSVSGYLNYDSILYYKIIPSSTIPSKKGTIILLIDNLIEKFIDINYITIKDEIKDIDINKKKKILELNKFISNMKSLMNIFTDSYLPEFDPNRIVITYKGKSDFIYQIRFNDLLVYANIYNLLKLFIFDNNGIVTLESENKGILEEILYGIILNHFISDSRLLDDYLDFKENLKDIVQQMLNDVLTYFIEDEFKNCSLEEKMILFEKEFNKKYE